PRRHAAGDRVPRVPRRLAMARHRRGQRHHEPAGPPRRTPAPGSEDHLMVDGTSTDDRDGLRTLMQAYDGAYVPRFEVYVGPNDTPATDGRVLEHEQAIEEEKNRINNRIFRQTTTTSQPTTQQLIPLTGVYGQHPEKGRRNDVRSVEFTESVGHEGQLAQVRVEVHNVYDPRTQRYYYTDRVEDDDFDPILQIGLALALRMRYHGSI